MDRLPTFIISIKHYMMVTWTLLKNTFANSRSAEESLFLNCCLTVKQIKLPNLAWLCLMIAPDYYPDHYCQEISSSQLKRHHMSPKWEYFLMLTYILFLQFWVSLSVCEEKYAVNQHNSSLLSHFPEPLAERTYSSSRQCLQVVKTIRLTSKSCYSSFNPASSF